MAGSTPLAAFPYPGVLDDADIPGDIQAALLAVERKVVLTFSTATARDSAITSPTAGMVAYLTTPRQLTVYDGTGWVILSAAGTWTCASTNSTLNVGSTGSITAEYAYARGMLGVSIVASLAGSGISVTGTVELNLPPGFTPLHAGSGVDDISVGIVCAGTVYIGTGRVSGTSIGVYALRSDSTYVTRQAPAASTPGTWTGGDSIRVKGVVMGTLA